jgi:DNA-binding transcriptional LysR family regulator
MIEIYLLEQLAAFQKYGTLSSAAEHLHLTQPSLTRSMKKLEEQIGVPLFDRERGRLHLNETGLLAALYAKEILQKEENMVFSLQQSAKNLHHISIGSCAPGPLMILKKEVSYVFHDASVSDEMQKEELLPERLKKEEDQLIILSKPIEDEEIGCIKWLHEKLYLSVSPLHPASSYSSITFRQMDGQNFVMLADVGIWNEVAARMMPHAHFLKQESLEDVSTIIHSSELPSFASSITIHEIPSRRERINIPFTDPEADIVFYAAYLKKNTEKLSALLSILNKK